jgi:hypothetical protein
MKPLSANREHASCLCSGLGLGNQRGELARVYGGLHHWMWRLETDRASYAVKQLGADVDLGDPAVVAHYNISEQVAAAFASRGVGAISALAGDSGYLQLIGEGGYLVYPWTDASAVDCRAITERHARKVAGLLAAMHRADIHVPQLADTEPEVHPEDKIRLLVDGAVRCHGRDSRQLAEQLPTFLRIAGEQTGAIGVLQGHRVVSHGDADHKNVLWSASGGPVLIDWESARRLNPVYETVLEALDWSGITTTFHPDRFHRILAAYREAGGSIDGDLLEASFACILGDWLNWLMFNVGRSIDAADARLRRLGAEQVDNALSALLRLQRVIPHLLASPL